MVSCATAGLRETLRMALLRNNIRLLRLVALQSGRYLLAEQRFVGLVAERKRVASNRLVQPLVITPNPHWSTLHQKNIKRRYSKRVLTTHRDCLTFSKRFYLIQTWTSSKLYTHLLGPAICMGKEKTTAGSDRAGTIG